MADQSGGPTFFLFEKWGGPPNLFLVFLVPREFAGETIEGNRQKGGFPLHWETIIQGDFEY